MYVHICIYIYSYRIKSYLNMSPLSLQSTTSLINMMISFHIPMNFMGIRMKEMMAVNI